MSEEFDYRKGTIGVVCPDCDKEITEYELNKFNPKLFQKNKEPAITIKELEKWLATHDDYFFKPHHTELLSWAKKRAKEGEEQE